MKKAAPTLIILAGCLWGTTGVFVRSLGDFGFTSMQIVEVRAILATLMIFLIVFFYDRSLFRIKLRDLWCFLGTGVLSVVSFSFCYFKTIELTSLSVAAIMLYTAPLFVMLMSRVLFSEKLSRSKVVALILAFGGCILVSGVLSSNASLSLSGVLFGLGSGIGYALYSIFTRFAINRGYHALTIMIYTFFFASIGGAFFTDFTAMRSIVFEAPSILGFLALYVLTTTILPYLFYTLGLGKVENSRASIMVSIEPVVATLIGILFFAEVPTFSAFLGMALVISALVLLNVRALMTSPRPSGSEDS
ncbi:MAG: EamA family transporter [Actinobacteria bacterium]|nr:EamA family transporter [Actinomycetota bacterium]